MYVFFIIMFYCVYGQMSEIKNYYYYTITIYLYFYCIFTVFLLYFYCIFTVFLLYFYCIFTVFLLYFYCIFTVFLLYFYCINIIFFYIINVTILSLYWNKYPCWFIKHNIIIKVKKNTARNTRNTTKRNI